MLGIVAPGEAGTGRVAGRAGKHPRVEGISFRLARLPDVVGLLGMADAGQRNHGERSKQSELHDGLERVRTFAPARRSCWLLDAGQVRFVHVRKS